MGLDHGVGNGATPFQSTNRKDGEAAVTRDIPQISGEVPFSLPAQSGNAMRWHIGKNAPVQRQILQVFQAVQQAVHVGRVPPDLELTQPDEPRDRAARIIEQQGIKLCSQDLVQPTGDPGINSPFGRDKRIRAKPLDDRDARQNDLGRPALLHEAPRQILVRAGSFGCFFQLGLQVASPTPREHLVTVDLAQGSQVLMSGLIFHQRSR